MQAVFIVPIGGILVALGVFIVLGAMWLWNTATAYKDALIDFANRSSDTVVIVIGLIALAIALLVVLLQYFGEDHSEKRGKTIPVEIIVRILLLAAPSCMALSGIYAWSIAIINYIVNTIAESFLFWISVPLLFLFGLAGVVVGFLPISGLYFLEYQFAEADTDSFNCRFLLPAIAEVVAILLYLFLIISSTNLPQYLANSFSTW